MPKKKKSNSTSKKSTKQSSAKRPSNAKRKHSRLETSDPSIAADGPVTFAEAQVLAQAQLPPPANRASGPRSTLRAVRTAELPPTPAAIGIERERLRDQQQTEIERRVQEYQATMSIMKRRGVKGMPVAETDSTSDTTGAPQRRSVSSRLLLPLLQIFAEGDSWFDYPVPLFGGGIIPRLQKLLGVPILNLAQAGDEVRFMLGVEQRKLIEKHLRNGCPAGGAWDAMLFSGGGNDIVGDPMMLWIRDFQPSVPPEQLINQTRFAAVLQIVKAGYEDLIELRDTLSPGTHLFFHGYDFAIPDGRGICHLGPWLKPTFQQRKFPTTTVIAGQVVKIMLQKFATMLKSLQSQHDLVTFINGQGTLNPVPGSWHNELHPGKSGFQQFAAQFHRQLQAQFPDRLPSKLGSARS